MSDPKIDTAISHIERAVVALRAFNAELAAHKAAQGLPLIAPAAGELAATQAELNRVIPEPAPSPLAATIREG